MKNNKIETYKNYLINWLRDWFKENGPECNACVGISGGKDSTCVAALCVEALGKDRVIGVLMPNGEQGDISDSYAICRHLGIRPIEINLAGAYYNILKQFPREGIKETSEQTKINLAPRLRMSILYAVAQSLNGRVIGTSNLDEYLLGWETRWGDSVADCEPIIKLHVSEVIELGLSLGVPEKFMIKPASDGLTGKTDEDNFGFTYQEFENFFKMHLGDMMLRWPGEILSENEEKMYEMWKKSRFKRNPIPEPTFYPHAFDDEDGDCEEEAKC